MRTRLWGPLGVAQLSSVCTCLCVPVRVYLCLCTAASGQPGEGGVVAGWGFGHGKPFSKSGLVWRTRSGNESEWAPRLVQLFLVFLPLAVARFLADSLHRFPLVRRSLRRRARRGLAN